MRFSLLIVTFFLFRFHFLPQGRKFPPLSHYIVNFFFFCLPRNCWVGGTNSHSHFRRCSEFFFEAPHPTPVCRVFCLALQAYQVRSGAFVSGIFLFPSRRVSSSRCPRTDAWKMSWLCLTELYSSLVPMPFRLLQFVPWAQCFLKPPPLGFPPQVPPYEFPSIFEGKLWVPFLLYTSPLCSLYRLPLLLLGIIVHVSVIRLLYFLSFVLRKQNGSSLSFLFHLR